MCGIFGAVWIDPGEVKADQAVAALAHRGPDASGVWRGRDAVMGHTRLAVVDLSAASAQPMMASDGGAVLVFNGEIYNHRILREELSALGERFRSRGDTEVILAGYRAWGEGVVERLDGMFAFGLWDERRRRLLLARDRPGKKPLYYTELGRGFRFASEVKALLASGIPAEPEPAALPALLSFGYTPAPMSMIKGVAQLAPASMMVIDEGKAPVVRRYWRPPFGVEPIRCSQQDAVQQVRKTVEQAVERRLEADVPLGAFLSGGLDSTVVVAVMSRSLGYPVKTFSIGFRGDPRYDETRYARLAAQAFATEHVEFTLEPSSFDLVASLVDLHDGPFGDSSAIPSAVVSRLTRQHVTVALTGDGGDEVFCGYHRFLAAEAAERIPSAALRAASLLARWLPSGNGERSLATRARRFFSAAELPLAERLTRWMPLFAGDLERLILPEVRRTIPLDGPHSWMADVVAHTAGTTALQRILEHNFETYLPYDLLVKADRTSMGHGLETRSPFLDTSVVELAARLPDHYKRRGLTTKWILRRAFADLIPAPILRRGKMGFGVPLGAWFRHDLRDYLRDHLAGDPLLGGYLDRRFVAGVVDEHLAGRADHGHRLWLLLTLEVWLRSLRHARAVEPRQTAQGVA
jgi:asparagine synthase (glutamine-hydrolysing)